ncbi:hypothetical protein SLI_6943 [Streptomyces lividans 1326]|uniref:Uncharacterized protein n=1 Tax=Streptomyces lividans 1326 TaxID=1200984 RepID=A0A7U9HFD0_STRLI|nr:hypothetical protein SLI_6943 [Streptomyces lividans 1326]
MRLRTALLPSLGLGVTASVGRPGSGPHRIFARPRGDSAVHEAKRKMPAGTSPGRHLCSILCVRGGT